MRVCVKCQEEKPLNAFWRQASRRDGYQAACVECMTASHKSWRGGLGKERRTELHARNAESVRRGRERDPLGLMYRSIRARAKKAGIECTISRDDIVIPSHCPVLGIPLKFGVRRGPGLAERDQRPSVDRIDNSRGYTPDNIVVVSYRANRIKSDATLHELEAVAEFYRNLDEVRGRSVGRVRSDRAAVGGREREDNMPEMQRRTEKEKRPMSERDKGVGRDLGALPSLRLVGRSAL